MIIDYACYNYELNEHETQEEITKALKYGATSISVLPYSLNTIKLMENRIPAKIPVSCVLDFPYGLADWKSRVFMVGQIIKHSAKVKYVDLMIPTKVITNRKYDKFREEIKALTELCGPENVGIRYILEYRIFKHETLDKVCKILQEFNLDTVFTSSGATLDNVEDNLIACNFLTMKSNIRSICTGNVYNDKHVKLIKNTPNISGVRFFYTSGLELFNKISV
jgi:deoxyribose-phosphate aldolase